MSLKGLLVRFVAPAILAALDGFAPPSMAAPPVPASAGLVVRVEAKFEVSGDLRLPADTRPDKLPMSVVARFAYLERRIDDGSVNAERRSIRFYNDAQAAIKVEKQASISKLAPDRQLVRVAVSGGKTTLGAVRGNLTREERELLELPYNTLVLDRLLPPKSAQKGSSSKPDDSALAMLLGLDVVNHSDVTVVLTAVSNGVGELAIQGTLDGSAAGVATEIQLSGKLHFDVAHQQPFALAAVIKEKRSSGEIAPGLDVVAKLQLQITPAGDATQLSDKSLAGVELAADGKEPPLAYESAESEFTFLYEPRWRLTRTQPDSAVMRLVDRGEVVAQCNLSVLPKVESPAAITLETFQKEVQQSLGKHFGYLERAGQRQTATGLRLLDVVAGGNVSDVPITWHYFLLIGEAGERAAISFTMEDALADRFGEADQLVVEQFRFNKSRQSAARAPKRSPR
jgi:hypothetical protein